MNDRAKGTILFIFIILAIIGFIFAFNSNIKANENRKLFEKEMAFRLDMEEKVSKLRNEKMDLTTALKNKDLEIQQKDQLIKDLNQTISEQKVKIEILQSELKKATLLKEELEDNLKEELSKKKQ
ncbi:MAG: hypothetical protein ISS47_00140 [Candidatus Omnitrophica bacterium]|nr:hypothetical protein [Candidatus Omnitrophota bacterium]